MKGLQLLTISVLLIVTVQVVSGFAPECSNDLSAKRKPCVKPMCCAQGQGKLNGWCFAGGIGELCGGVADCKCHKDLKCVPRFPMDPQSIGECKCKCDSGLTRGNLTF